MTHPFDKNRVHWNPDLTHGEIKLDATDVDAKWDWLDAHEENGTADLIGETVEGVTRGGKRVRGVLGENIGRGYRLLDIVVIG